MEYMGILTFLHKRGMPYHYNEWVSTMSDIEKLVWRIFKCLPLKTSVFPLPPALELFVLQASIKLANGNDISSLPFFSL